MEIKYTFNPENIPSKLNPQQKQLVEALKDCGTVQKAEILAALEGNLVTKQDPWLIFKYYQPGFIKSGFVELDKIVKEKPAKKAKEVETIVVESLPGDPMHGVEGEQVESVEALEAQGF